MIKLLSGNEAIALGAYEGGVTVATGYPGTPSTEILEALVGYKSEVYCEWAPNEKVAFEVAAGASLAGARTIVTMKHVGLNVASDPLMTFSYIGAVGGFVACVADDPGMHSSQTEQDTRQYARLAKIPLFDPSDAAEARDFVLEALTVSETFNTPVILRSSTRMSHSRSLVTPGERMAPRKVEFVKNPPQFVPIPIWGRKMRQRVEERLAALREAAEKSPANRIERRDPKLGIITSAVAYQYVREVFPEASVLKLGWSYPYPDALIRTFAAEVDRVMVVEEGDDFLEEHIRSLGIMCDGRNLVHPTGELSPTRLLKTRAALEGTPEPATGPVADTADLPVRPPVLCPGCPHRGVFYALGRFDVVVTGDIGCYSLGTFQPLDRMDTILCMGAGISMAQGMEKAGEPKPVVGIVGDSTFFHSGITGLLDIVYNRGTSTIIVVDNRTTAMTGHQDHPGTGRTLMGESVPEVSIEAIGRACGIKRVRTVNPYNLAETIEAIKEEIEAKEPSLIISLAPCALRGTEKHSGPLTIDADACVNCGRCVKLGCPALESGNTNERPQINELLCFGCGMCMQVCRRGAIALCEEAQQ